MIRLDPAPIAAAILAAPATQLLALSVPSPRIRERAAERLARAIVGEEARADPRQLALPL